MAEPFGIGIAGVLLCAYFWSVAHIGIEFSDEGYIIYPAYQVSEGLVPYRDIVSLYTPLTWYLHGALFKLFGLDLIPIRYVFSVVKVCILVLTYLLARRLMSPGFALIAPAVLFLVDPAPRHWAPYPAYYGLAGVLAALLTVSRFIATRRTRWLFAAGVACAFVFASKPSIGLFTMAALSAFFVYNAPDLRSFSAQASQGGDGHYRLLRLVSWCLVLGSAGAAALVLRHHLNAATIGTLLMPVLAAGLLHVAANHSATAGATLSAVAWRIGALWSGFLIVTVPWLSVLALSAGVGLTLQSVFLNGIKTADAFFVPYTRPNADALDAGAWMIAAALVAAAWSVLQGRGILSRRRDLLVAAVIAGAVGLGALLAFLAYRARGLGTSLWAYLDANLQGRLARNLTESDDLIMYVPLIGFWLGCAWLLMMAARRMPVDARLLHVRLLVLFGSLFLLQLYPKVSHYHVLFTMTPFLVLLALVLSQVYGWCIGQWRERRPGPLTRWALTLCFLVFPLHFLPTVVRLRANVMENAEAAPATAFSQLRISNRVAERLDGVGEYIKQRTVPGEPIFVYPASPMFYLATQRPNPTRFSYLPSGYVDEQQQEEIIDALESRGVRWIIWDQELIDRWRLLPMDRPLADYIWTHYLPAVEVKNYTILERIGPEQ